MKKLLLAALLAALVLTACAPSAGQAVEIRSGAYGCRTWYAAAVAWVNCYPASELPGVVEDHPDGLGHDFNGRIRVRLEGDSVLWFERGDIRVVP